MNFEAPEWPRIAFDEEVRYDVPSVTSATPEKEKAGSGSLCSTPPAAIDRDDYAAGA